MSEATTLSQIMDEFAAGGYVDHFAVGDEPLVHCDVCGVDSPPSDIDVTASRRVEGASDPADMSTVYAVRCPACGRQGTLVLRYGPESSPSEATVSQGFRDERHGDDGYTTPVEAGHASASPTSRAPAYLDPDAPGSSLFTEGDDVEPNEPA